MRKKTLSVIIFFLANLYVFAQATPQKYGYINSEYIFTKLPEYKDSKSKLDKLSDRWMKEIEDKIKETSSRNIEKEMMDKLTDVEKKISEIEEIINDDEKFKKKDDIDNE